MKKEDKTAHKEKTRQLQLIFCKERGEDREREREGGRGKREGRERGDRRGVKHFIGSQGRVAITALLTNVIMCGEQCLHCAKETAAYEVLRWQGRTQGERPEGPVPSLGTYRALYFQGFFH